MFIACQAVDPEEEPTALFSFAQKGTTISFTNGSKNAQSYVWNFGDDESSTEKSPVHTYKIAGEFTVVLTATNVTKTSKYSQKISIVQSDLKPTAKFTYSVDNFTVSFTNTSTNGNSYQWAFGDGQNSSEKSPTHTYSKAGTYEVRLTTVNGNQSDTYSQSITLTEKEPSASFSYNANNLTVSFNNSSTNAQSYKWEFGDGKTTTEKNPTHTYTNEGTYRVTLTVTNNTKSNSTSQSITLSSPSPKANFTYKTEHPLKVVLTNTSSNATSYEWNFGDGKTSTEKNPIHKYSSIGVYRVMLTAKNGNKSNTYETNVEIKAPSTCYMTEFSINKVPTNNKYYQVQLTDDYWISKTEYFHTEWYLLSSANLPFSHTLKTQQKLNIEDKYVIRLYKYTGTGNPSNNSAASGGGDWSATIAPADLKKYPESLTYSNSTAGMTVKFLWK